MEFRRLGARTNHVQRLGGNIQRVGITLRPRQQQPYQLHLSIYVAHRVFTHPLQHLNTLVGFAQSRKRIRPVQYGFRIRRVCPRDLSVKIGCFAVALTPQK